MTETVTYKNNTEPPYVSYSRLKLYDKCPRCYWWQYIIGYKPLVDPVHFTFGRAFHKGLENHFKGKGDPIEAFRTEMSANASKTKFPKGDSLSRSADIGTRLLQSYIDSDEKYHLVAAKGGVEESILVDLVNPLTGENSGTKLKCIIDLRTEDDIIGEHKTSASEWKEEQVHSEVQASAETLAFFLKYKRMPKMMVYTIFVKQITNPRFQQHITTREMKDMVFFYEWATDILSKIREGLFPKKYGVTCADCYERETAERRMRL